jgi:hypothetical protein
MLIDEGEKLGLVINVAKCEIITDDDEVLQKVIAIVPGIKHINTTSAMLLGAPIGGDQSVDEVLEAKLQELRRLSDRVSLLNACSRRAVSAEKLFFDPKTVIHVA